MTSNIIPRLVVELLNLLGGGLIAVAQHIPQEDEAVNAVGGGGSRHLVGVPLEVVCVNVQYHAWLLLI